ncbi:MAG: hypothetical protein AAF330_01085 [Pseudomonadota bacterium]
MELAQPHLLFLGDLRGWHREGGTLPVIPNASYMDVTDLSADELDRVKPDIILCPLFTARFDAVLIASLLHAMQFKGSLRAMSRPLPEPSIIAAEVASAAPSIDFDLFFF